MVVVATAKIFIAVFIAVVVNVAACRVDRRFFRSMSAIIKERMP